MLCRFERFTPRQEIQRDAEPDRPEAREPAKLASSSHFELERGSVSRSASDQTRIPGKIQRLYTVTRAAGRRPALQNENC